MRELPSDYWPSKRVGWEELHSKRATEWMNANQASRAFDDRVYLTTIGERSVAVYLSKQKEPGAGGLSRPTFKYGVGSFSVRDYEFAAFIDVTFREGEASKLSKVQRTNIPDKGDEVRVRGKIEHVEVRKGTIGLRLVDAELN
jgi:hypothetical protein